MKCAHIGVVLNSATFKKYVKPKTRASCHVSLLDVDKNLEMIQPFSSGVIIALCWFSKMAAWRPYLKSDRYEIR
jgi:hypothetical protein